MDDSATFPNHFIISFSWEKNPLELLIENYYYTNILKKKLHCSIKNIFCANSTSAKIIDNPKKKKIKKH